jgi:predicted nucleic acid-binding protein
LNRYTIDASVHLNALNPAEPGSADSQILLESLFAQSATVFSPHLLLVEVASSVSRVFRDPARGLALAQAIRLLPGQTWVALDDTLVEEACSLGALYRLRGADAVYAAVAHRYQTVLVTLDREQLERLSPLLRVQNPASVLAGF